MKMDLSIHKIVFSFLLAISMVFFCCEKIIAQVSFQKSYGGSFFQNEMANSVEQTSDGGYIISGVTNSFGNGSQNIYQIRTNTSGDIIWTKAYGGMSMSDDIGRTVKQMPDGGFITVGYGRSFSFTNDFYLMRTDTAGNLMWTKRYGGGGDDVVRNLEMTNDGGFVVIGYTNSFGSGMYDVLAIKTNSNGDTLWTRTYGTSSTDDWGHAVQQTTDGGYIIGGSTGTFPTARDVFLIKVDANGNLIWSKKYGGSNIDFTRSVQQTADGGFILAGYTESFGTGGDFYLIKTDPTGNIQWSMNYGENGNDLCEYVKQTIDGGYILCGYTNISGSYDVFLIKVDLNGAVLWRKIFGGAGADMGRSLNLTTDGGFVVAGETSSFGDATNVFLIKTDALGNIGSCLQFLPPTIVQSSPPTTTFPVATVQMSPSVDTSTVSLIMTGASTSMTPVCGIMLIGNICVTDTNDSGPGTLREAILNTNSTPGPDTICFNIAGSGPHNIQLLSDLPDITGQVFIDGYTQAGSAVAVGITPATLKVSVKGSGVVNRAFRFVGNSNKSVIRGLNINGFAAAAIRIDADSIWVIGNHIGTNIDGTDSISNGTGVRINIASYTTIGGNSSDMRNVISGNRFFQVLVDSSSGDFHSIKGNYIGLNAAGNARISGGPKVTGIHVVKTTNSIIGGANPDMRNIISGNFHGIVFLSSSTNGNFVEGNFIGTNRTGLSPIPNDSVGIMISDSSYNNYIGGLSFGSRNIISGNGVDGIAIKGTGSMFNYVEGNFIGVNVTGTAAIQNGSSGVSISEGATHTFIGNPGPALRNVISGNYYGIKITGSGTSANEIQNNYIGTDSSGMFSIGNIFNGIQLENFSSINTIGGNLPSEGNLVSGNTYGISINASDSNYVIGNLIGTNATGNAALKNTRGIIITNGSNNFIGGNTTDARNIISGNSWGITLAGSLTSLNTIRGNYIGMNITGVDTLPNNMGGVILLSGPTNNTIGGASANEGNVISGNAGYGVLLSDIATSFNKVWGNKIGTNTAGTLPLPNAGPGVRVFNSPNNAIGGLNNGEGNIISGNATAGIEIVGVSSSFNEVQGNLIGTDTSGIIAIPNFVGIKIGESADSNLIGGPVQEARNLISGNNTAGVMLTQLANNNNIFGNYIGTNADGTLPLSNDWGLLILNGASKNLIGGGGPGQENIVSGNDSAGVVISDTGTSENKITGNKIGTDTSGINPLGNVLTGIYIGNGATLNTIGGALPSEGNIIAYNGYSGIIIELPSSVGNQLLSNIVRQNVGIGIDLNADGVTPNDPGDPDVGPNNLQNFPVLTGAFSCNGNDANIYGTLNSIPNTLFKLQFFVSVTPDPSGYGEAERFIGDDTVTTGNTGTVTFGFAFNNPIFSGEFISATATDISGNNTSEFCGNILVTNAPLPPSVIKDTVYCYGDPIVALTASGIPGGTLTWYDDSLLTNEIGKGDSLVPFNVVGTTKYYVTDSIAGCTTSPYSVSVTINPVYTISDPGVSICSGDSILLGGTYQTAAGTYFDTLATIVGCDSVISTTLTVNPTYFASVSETICSGDSILLGGTYQATAGTYFDTLATIVGCDSAIVTSLTVNPVYNISDPGISICTGDSTLIYGTLQSTAGIYYDLLLSADNCDSVHFTVLTVNPTYSIFATATICAGDSILLGGSNQFTSGTYSDLYNSVNGCDSMIITTLTVNPAITLALASNDALCYGSCDGSAIVNATSGNGTYNYLWDDPDAQTDSVATGLCTGIYSVTVTDGTSCMVSSSIPVVQPSSPLSVTLQSVIPPTCLGSCDGELSVFVSGGTSPYNYVWNDPGSQTTASATGLCADNYLLSITDSNDCIDSLWVLLPDPPMIILTITGNDLICAGSCSGDAFVSPTGGTSPFTYSWNTTPVQTDSIATGLCAGIYTVSATDGNGCSTTNNFTITELLPENPSFSYSDSVFCKNGANPFPIIAGDPDGSFSASPDITIDNISGEIKLDLSIAGGPYDIVYTTGGPCPESSVFSLSLLEVPFVTAQEISPICGVDTGVVNLSATPPGGAWAGFGIIDTAIGLFSPNITGPGLHPVIYTFSNGVCSNSDAIIIPVLPVPSVNISGNTTICSGSSASFLLNLQGVPPFNIEYTDGINNFILSGLTPGDSITVTPLDTTIYTLVSISDSFACTGNTGGSVTINVISKPPPPMVTSPVYYCEGGSLTPLSAIPQTGGSILWYKDTLSAAIDSGNSFLPDPIIGSNNYYALETINGCNSSFATINLYFYGQGTISAGQDAAICLGSSVQLNASGGILYLWSPETGLSNSSIANPFANPVSSITYHLLAFVNDSCSYEDSIRVTVDNTPDCGWYVYNAFTPNKDGDNDHWIIDGITKFPINKVSIFNRWEDIVNVFENYNNTTVVWDGNNSKGNELPDGTYFYIILAGDKNISGWVQITR